MSNLRFTKNIFHTSVLALTTLCLGISSSYSVNSKVLAQSLSSEPEPSCYIQTASRTVFDLSALCGGKKQTAPVSFQEGRPTLSIEKFSILRDKGGHGNQRYIGGIVKNNGQNSESNIKVYYKMFGKHEGVLKTREYKSEYVDPIKVYPDSSGVFVSEFDRHLPPEAVLVTFIESSESGLIPVNICYASSVERRELCKMLSPTEIRAFDKL